MNVLELQAACWDIVKSDMRVRHTHATSAGSEASFRNWWFSAAGGGGGAIEDRLHAPFSQVSTVYKAVTSIGRNLAGVNLEFFDRKPGGKVDFDSPLQSDHAAVRLFNRPNSTTSRRQLIHRYVQRMELTGDFFLHMRGVARTGVAGQGAPLPTELVVLHSSGVTPDEHGGELVGWKYRDPATGRQEKFSKEEILHDYYPAPDDDYMGCSPLEAAWLEIDTDYQAALFERFFFENNTAPDLILMRKGDAKGHPASDAIWLQQFKDRHRRPRNMRGTGILPDGMEAMEIGLGRRGMTFGDLRRFSREQILATFDVPPAVAGVFEYANYANSREQLRYFWYHKLYPMMDNLETAIQVDLLDRFGHQVVARFNREQVQALIEDTAQKLELALKAWGMGTPLRKANERFGVGLDLDGVPGADVAVWPFSVTPVEDVLQARAIEEESMGIEGHAARSRSSQTTRRRVSDIERTYGGRLRKVFEDLGSQVLVRIKKLKDEDCVVDPEEFSSIHLDSYGRLGSARFYGGCQALIRSIEEDHGDDVLDLGVRVVLHAKGDDLVPDAEDLARKLETTSRSAFTRTIARSVEVLAAETGKKIEFNLLDPKVVKFLKSKVIKVTDALDDTKDALRATLAAGIKAGESPTSLAERVRHVMDVSRSRSETIARTEVGQAFTGGRFMAMDQNGIKRHQWLHAGDADVRPGHRIDEVEEVGEKFSNDLRYPLDPEGAPENVINCRCDTRAVK